MGPEVMQPMIQVMGYTIPWPLDLFILSFVGCTAMYLAWRGIVWLFWKLYLGSGYAGA